MLDALRTVSTSIASSALVAGALARQGESMLRAFAALPTRNPAPATSAVVMHWLIAVADLAGAPLLPVARASVALDTLGHFLTRWVRLMRPDSIGSLAREAALSVRARTADDGSLAAEAGTAEAHLSRGALGLWMFGLQLMAGAGLDVRVAVRLHALQWTQRLLLTLDEFVLAHTAPAFSLHFRGQLWSTVCDAVLFRLFVATMEWAGQGRPLPMPNPSSSHSNRSAQRHRARRSTTVSSAVAPASVASVRLPLPLRRAESDVLTIEGSEPRPWWYLAAPDVTPFPAPSGDTRRNELLLDFLDATAAIASTLRQSTSHLEVSPSPLLSPLHSNGSTPASTAPPGSLALTSFAPPTASHSSTASPLDGVVAGPAAVRGVEGLMGLPAPSIADTLPPSSAPNAGDEDERLQSAIHARPSSSSSSSSLSSSSLSSSSSSSLSAPTLHEQTAVFTLTLVARVVLQHVPELNAAGVIVDVWSRLLRLCMATHEAALAVTAIGPTVPESALAEAVEETVANLVGVLRLQSASTAPEDGIRGEGGGSTSSGAEDGAPATSRRVPLRPSWGLDPDTQIQLLEITEALLSPVASDEEADAERVSRPRSPADDGHGET